ncbi:MAG: T9SS type A sorting domain-containing protein [Bacteroidia bacterium]|nr:T9SS type A sorting domain-containing protein [Bacteroidia bacterium]
MEIDSSFGDNGKLYYALDGATYTQILDAKNNAKEQSILLMMRWTGSGGDVWLGKLKKAGIFDSSFGFSGVLPIGEYALNAADGHVFLDSASNIYVWGISTSYTSGGTNYKHWFHKYNSLGEKDTSFHVLDSIINKNYNRGNCFFANPSQNGSFYISTGSYNNSVWKIWPNGLPDSTWGGDGRVDSICPCAKGVFESKDGSVNILGTANNNSTPVIWILNHSGTLDLKRTSKGWLTAPVGPASQLLNGEFCINSAGYTKNYGTIKTLAYQNAFIAKAGFGANGRNSIIVDSACVAEPAFSMVSKSGNIITFWNRYSFDDNNNYIEHKCGYNIVNNKGVLIPQIQNWWRRYLIPKEKNNHKIVSFLEYPDSSFLAAFNIWNSGSYATLLVKYKPINISEPNLNLTEQVQNQQVIAYPNPSNGVFELVIPSEFTDIAFQLLDAGGRAVAANYEMQNNGKVLVHTEAQSGIYFLIAKSQGLLVSQRIQILRD